MNIRLVETHAGASAGGGALIVDHRVTTLATSVHNWQRGFDSDFFSKSLKTTLNWAAKLSIPSSGQPCPPGFILALLFQDWEDWSAPQLAALLASSPQTVAAEAEPLLLSWGLSPQLPLRLCCVHQTHTLVGLLGACVCVCV